MDSIGNTIVSSTESIKKFNDNFKSFTTNQTLVLVAAAVCIGMATKDAIEKILNQVIYPFIASIAKISIAFILYKKALENTQSYKTIHSVLESIGAVFWIFIVWSIIIFFSYILLKKVLVVDFVKPHLQFVEDNSKKYLIGTSQESRA